MWLGIRRTVTVFLGARSLVSAVRSPGNRQLTKEATMNLVKRLIREEEGQDIIEYVLIAAGISVVAIPLIPTIGTNVLTRWTTVSNAVAS
jgi:pilus assembly protein Flp/PilA